MMGLATDGGLILPQSFPRISDETLQEWIELRYQDLAFEIIKLFATDIPDQDLRLLISRSYASFEHEEVTPLTALNRIHILELFHGPTYAFKDVALQFLGNLFSYLLEKDRNFMNILGATSGDTGSAAIYGVRGKPNINIFILHPHGRVSPVQALQMTTVAEENVFNLAIEGTFDDCQAIVKAIFNDIDFKGKYSLGAVNSINWARVMAQVVYYVYAALKLKSMSHGSSVHFSVPTGNFGDIFAGYVARRLTGRLIGRLILATNENNILTRFVLEGRYERGKVIPTLSPSMDIQVASNFERYLYFLFDQDSHGLKQAMEEFSKTGKLSIESSLIQRVRQDFSSASIDQQTTVATIRDFYKRHHYVMDPHTAVGVAAARKLMHEFPEGPIVCLATAHAAKFPEAVKKAIGREPARPRGLQGIEDKKARFKTLPPNVDAVKEFIEDWALKKN